MTISENEQQRVIDWALRENACTPEALLPVLHAIQDALQYIPELAFDALAHALNLSRADIFGVISFYSDFRLQPPGRHLLRLCRAEACQAMGGRSLEAEVRRRLQIEFHATTDDGHVTLEPVYCLGACACAPALTLDGSLHGRVDLARLSVLLDQLEIPR